MPVSLEGAAPRSSDEAEAAVYFCCLEAIQNVAKHAGRHARVILRLRHDHGALAVGIEDDGRGFDPAHRPEGAALRNIHDRIGTLGGTVTTTSSPGHGTVLTIALPWPPRRPVEDPHPEAAACADRNPAPGSGRACRPRQQLVRPLRVVKLRVGASLLAWIIGGGLVH